MLKILMAIITVILAAPSPDSPQQQVSEYQVKSVFIYHFSHFVDWPEQAFETNTSPFVIGIIGENPFSPYLQETVKEEKVKNREFVIRKFESIGEIKNCHILFISSDMSSELKTIIDTLAGTNILTVSEIEGFANSGGMIQFEKKQKSISLKINPEPAEKAQLSISSKLLNLAEIVSTGL